MRPYVVRAPATLTCQICRVQTECIARVLEGHPLPFWAQADLVRSRRRKCDSSRHPGRLRPNGPAATPARQQCRADVPLAGRRNFSSSIHFKSGIASSSTRPAFSSPTIDRPLSLRRSFSSLAACAARVSASTQFCVLRARSSGPGHLEQSRCYSMLANEGGAHKNATLDASSQMPIVLNSSQMALKDAMSKPKASAKKTKTPERRKAQKARKRARLLAERNATKVASADNNTTDELDGPDSTGSTDITPQSAAPAIRQTQSLVSLDMMTSATLEQVLRMLSSDETKGATHRSQEAPSSRTQTVPFDLSSDLERPVIVPTTEPSLANAPSSLSGQSSPRKANSKSIPENLSDKPSEANEAKFGTLQRLAGEHFRLHRVGVPSRDSPSETRSVRGAIDSTSKTSGELKGASGAAMKTETPKSTVDFGIQHAATSETRVIKRTSSLKRSERQVEASTLTAKQVEVSSVESFEEQPPVPRLSHGLDRVLFNRGVYELRDLRSNVYNFDPLLEKITPVEDFNFGALSQYVTSSRDKSLETVARSKQLRYYGSSSSMVPALTQLHFLISSWRKPAFQHVSRTFVIQSDKFTNATRAPIIMDLKWKDGVYAIDAVKGTEDDPTILSKLGMSMETLLTNDHATYNQYCAPSQIPPSTSDDPKKSAFHYSTLGKVLMRAQLDAYDPRLPGSGIFDLKSRGVLTVRNKPLDPETMCDYELVDRHGTWASYEREYHDMIRSAFLKYSLQVRMGRMDGIFVAYHNTQRIFGFQYIPLEELDMAIHGQRDPTLGHLEFKYSVELLSRLMDRATARFPSQSLRLVLETKDTGHDEPYMNILVRPLDRLAAQAGQECITSDAQDSAEAAVKLDSHGDTTNRDAAEIAAAPNNVPVPTETSAAKESNPSTFVSLHRSLARALQRLGSKRQKLLQAVKTSPSPSTKGKAKSTRALKNNRAEKDQHMNVSSANKRSKTAFDGSAGKEASQAVPGTRSTTQSHAAIPTMGLHLRVTNYVQDQVVTRPENLRAQLSVLASPSSLIGGSDPISRRPMSEEEQQASSTAELDWRITYRIMRLSDAEAALEWDASLLRRSKVINNNRRSEPAGHHDSWSRTLQRMSEEGKQWREEVADRLTRSKPEMA